MRTIPTMPVSIKNLTKQLMLITLNNGDTVHLAPNEISRPLKHVEINGNAKIEKLAANNSITLVQETSPAARATVRRGAAELAGEDQKVKRDHEPDKEPKRETRRK